jgi:hypothetical protein
LEGFRQNPFVMKIRLLVLTPMIWAAVASHASGAESGTEFFERKIRPVLVEKCYGCHSQAGGKSKGGLTLDTKAGWSVGGDSGPAVVPGRPEESLLIKALRWEDPDLAMPPKKEGGKLAADVVQAFAEWVRMGAPDPREGGELTKKDARKTHWSFQAVAPVDVPVVRDEKWCQSVVDFFVLSKLESAGLRPNPPADAGALLRRISYDLVGLPPTLEQILVFGTQWKKASEEDEIQLGLGRVPYKAGAAGFVPARSVLLEQWIDRLLASPQYGERWGRHWLDTARYSDTRGITNRYEDYRYENAWTYRDYVIQAFNEDKPYNQFVVEQLAADCIPGVLPGDPRLAALGFLTVGKKFENDNDVIDEQIDATTKAFLGLTVSCARCHDHKFDPIPTADYYSLRGIFDSVEEPDEKPLLSSHATAEQSADYEEKLRELEAQNADHYYELARQRMSHIQSNWEGWIAYYLSRVETGMATQSSQSYDVAKKYKLPELFYFNELANNFSGDAKHPVWGVLFRAVRAARNELEAGFASALSKELEADGRPHRINPMVRERLREAAPKSVGEAARAFGKLMEECNGKFDALLRARKAGNDLVPRPESALEELCSAVFPIPLRKEIDTTEKLMAFYRKIALRGDTAEAFLFKEINQLRMTHPGAPGAAMVVRDVAMPKDSPVFLRGDEAKKGKVVPRRFLECLSPGERKPYHKGSGRLELAEDIASADNPIFARVAVNRIWMHHFGAGIVPTPDDLGAMSVAPSHPELLDWLAQWFVKNGWSMKKLHKLILLSSAYRQSANPNLNPARAGAEELDPENRLLWRANLRRLDMEAIRDSLVLLTGRMDLRVGGKPINLSEEPFSYRRSVYGYVDRGELSDLHIQFDFADPSMPGSRRNSTTLPQQALLFLNNPLVIDVARNLAARVSQEHDWQAQVRLLYRILFQRFPSQSELWLAKSFLNRPGVPTQEHPPERHTVPKSRNEAKKSGPSEKPEATRKPVVAEQKREGMGMTPAKKNEAIKNPGVKIERKPLTPLELLAQALLCSNEFVYVP